MKLFALPVERPVEKAACRICTRNTKKARGECYVSRRARLATIDYACSVKEVLVAVLVRGLPSLSSLSVRWDPFCLPLKRV